MILVKSAVLTRRVAESKASSTDSNKLPTPEPCNAEIKCNLAKSIKPNRRSNSRFTSSLMLSFRPSHLLTAITSERPEFSTKPKMLRSWSEMPCCASSTKITTLASSIACRVLTTENFSTTSSILPRRRTPAVSIRVYLRSPRSIGM